jgi:hypothetical protein
MIIRKKRLKPVNRRRTGNTMAKRKMTNNDSQNTTQKTKDRATRTPTKTGGELRSMTLHYFSEFPYSSGYIMYTFTHTKKT